MKHLMPLLAVAFLFASCERIEGQLNISSDTKLVSSKGVTRTLRVGTYSADIKANTSKKITLRLNNDGDEKYIFTLPDGSRIPSNGSFAFKSSDVGQPVDLNGTVATTTVDGKVSQGYESCTYQTPVQVCYPTPNGGATCSIQYETRQGQKWIKYFDRTTTRDVTLSISAANSGVESAQFQGDIVGVDRIVLNESVCR